MEIPNQNFQNENNNDCWVTFYEDNDCKGKYITIYGPCKYPKLKDLPGSDNKDWGDEIGSIRTGPKAWLVVYNDENYSDDRSLFGPDSVANAPSDDDIDSFQLFDSPPHI